MDNSNNIRLILGQGSQCPLRLKDGLYKYIAVVPCDGKKYEGWLKTIDPESGSIVLVNFSSEKVTAVDVIMGHSYQTAEILKEGDIEMETKIKGLFCPENIAIPKEECKKRKEKLKCWLLKNRLPVEEIDLDVLAITDAVRIYPPYGVEQVKSSHAIALEKFRDLVKNMPNEDVL